MRKNIDNYYQKENFIELKTLEFYFHGNKQRAKNVFDIRHKLTSRGFELYIKYYLKKLGFKMSDFTGGLKADGGIDLKCNVPPLYVQCKKYIKNRLYKGTVKISDMRNFYGGVVSKYKGNIQNKDVIMLFATTGSFTHDSKYFAKINNIDLIDYMDIGEISDLYKLEDFLEEMKNKGYKLKNILNNEFTQTEINQLSFNFNELLSDDILTYLKNIRENIIEKLNLEESNTGLILDDNTLEHIANNRISNIGGLKKFYKNINNDYEKTHLGKYLNKIYQGLQILQN